MANNQRDQPASRPLSVCTNASAPVLSTYTTYLGDIQPSLSRYQRGLPPPTTDPPLPLLSPSPGAVLLDLPVDLLFFSFHWSNHPFHFFFSSFSFSFCLCCLTLSERCTLLLVFFSSFETTTTTHCSETALATSVLTTDSLVLEEADNR